MAQLPRLECDLVLEGAVTSAVVYLGFVARLSRRYRFRSLAGASSGAAVAAAAAIAEATRARSESGGSKSFCQLLRFARKLGEVVEGETRLLRLFQPAGVLRLPFRVLVALLAWKSDPRRWRRIAVATAWTLVVVLVVIAALGGLFVPSLQPVSRIVLPLLLAGIFALAWMIGRAWVAQHFGLCTGMPVGHPPRDEVALTPALHELFNGLLGRTAADDPVAFADLWQAWPTGTAKSGRAIDLQVVTTVLQQRLSLHLPGRPGADPLRDYFYDPLEWALLFPASVMLWLERHARSAMPVSACEVDGAKLPLRTLRALPAPAVLPVIVAVRLSVSFPGLLSAIPLYTLAQGQGLVRPSGDTPARFYAHKVVFSDGGITSNLPIQVFDAPLPKRPTFAVNLFGLDKDEGEGEEHEPERRIFFGARRGEPETRPRALPAPRQWFKSLCRFVVEIVLTSKDWRDAVQRTLPGYRERVLHIGLLRAQGSLNLAMRRAQIRELVLLGTCAARRVMRDFSHPAEPGKASRWEEHRWLRLRSTLAASQVYLRALSAQPPGSHVAGEPTYRALLRNPSPAGLAFVDDDARRQAEALLDTLAAAGRGSRPDEGIEANLPDPAPDLRLGPPW